jgi:FAD/FMN-containing dehydrogenase/Fe-S oxidoreductase
MTGSRRQTSATSFATRELDRAGLRRELARDVDGEVRFDTASRALYASDASNFRQPPIGVVVPRSVDDVVATHAVCRRFGAPILCRGGGTSLSGETVNVAVVLDFSKYLNEILEVDHERRLAVVQPGAINDHVNEAASRHGLRFGPDPSTHAYCTIGGNVGNNSCGVHSVLAQFEGEGGRTSDNVHELEVLTYDGLRLRVGRTSDAELDAAIRSGGRRGEIYAALRDLRDRYADLIRERYPDIPRRVSGYNLDELLPERGFHVARALCGTEGTCVTVLQATLQLVPDPPERCLLVVGYRDIFEAGDHVSAILPHRPMALEGIDKRLIEDQHAQHMHPQVLALLPGEHEAWLLVELGGESREEAEAKAQRLLEELKDADVPPQDVKIFDDEREERKLWEIREAGLGATAFPPDDERDHWPGWEDSAVAPERVGDYLRDLKRLYDEYGYVGALYGHLGQGCVHSRINFDLQTAAGIEHYRAFLEDAADLVLSYGGSLSGEHGDGQQRAELLPRMFGEELVEAFREFKRIWDPDWKLNPGKVVDPYRLDENLRLGTGYHPPEPETSFSYLWDDGGSFAHATLRCVGIGKCRTPEGVDVMCPSYMATREEMHSTRGRARLLFEMLQGEIVEDGWRSEEVHEALDLCLACKGCTSDCPVHVDMPTYKAEFLSHYYAGRLRPRHAYAFGLVDRAARLAAKQPGAVNALTHAPVASRLVKWAAGMAPERDVPRFAPLTLQGWFRARRVANPNGPRVVLWPDTFSNYLHVEVGVAAVEALETAGFRVVVPRGHVCCGRPLYDYGFLGLAERYLGRVLTVLRDELRSGTPVVGIEPSCLAVFQDELPKLLPHDEDGKRLTELAVHLPELLEREQAPVPRLDGKALVWGHCHHKATGDLGAEQALLRRMGLDVEPLTGGCCGLAGSFGFEAGHYDVSMACGEQALLPAVRAAPADTIVVADGFSCQTQIEHATGRRALHVAQVLARARAAELGLVAPPAAAAEPPSVPRRRSAGRAAAGIAVAAALGAAATVGLRLVR